MIASKSLDILWTPIWRPRLYFFMHESS